MERMFAWLKSRSGLSTGRSQLGDAAPDTSTKEWAVRDFVYLDVERVKSILSQIEKGLLLEKAETKGFEKGGEAGVEGAIPMIAEVGGKWQLAWTSQATETRTLHDHIYNYTEARLLQAGATISLHEAKTLWLSDEARASLPSTAFVLVKGQVVLSDYSYLERMMSEFNEIADFVGRAAAQRVLEQQGLTGGKKERALREAGQQHKLEDWLQRGMLRILETFYGKRFLIRIVPFTDEPKLRVVGDLNRDFLRDPPESIMFKYGTAPVSEWTMFGQIASIPPKGHVPFALSDHFGPGPKDAMEKMFGPLRELEKLAITVSYPEISVTPIAVYRE